MPDAGLADGSVLTSANYDTYLRQQVVAQVTSGTRPTGVEGRLVTETDTDRIVCYDGTNWVRVGNYGSAGRSGVQLARFATQSIPTGTGTFTAVSWDVETTDTDGYIAATSDTITIPTGLGGLYAIWAVISWASTPGTNSTIEVYVNGTTSFRNQIGAATQMTTCAVSMPAVSLAAAQTIQIRLSQGSGGAINVTGNLEMWRLSA